MSETLIDAPLEKLQRLRDLRARYAGLDAGRAQRYRDDPASWVRERLGEHPWSEQVRIMESVRDHPRTAVQSCHGIGKSRVASWLAAWWLDTQPSGDAFLVTTAPRWDQVVGVMWRYIRATHREHDLVGHVSQDAKWKIDGALVGYGRKPADTDASGFQGVHATKGAGVLVIVDEACGVREQLFTAVDSLATNDASRVLAIGNPDDLSAHFAKICQTEPGWNRFKIDAFSSPNFTDEWVPDEVAESLVSRSWVEDKKIRWGESNPLYRAKVLAEFADAGDGLIPLSWVKAANARWETWHEQWTGTGAEGLWRGGNPEPAGRRLISCDVATTGEDKTAIATKQGDIIMGVERWSGAEIPHINGLIAERLTHPRAHAVVDAVGEGAGVYQTMRHDYPVTPFKGSYSTKIRDSAGMIKFPNVRVAAYYHLRELLNPALGATLALPPDDELTADLVTPKYEPRAGGYVWIESKDEIRKRLNRSIDAGDAVAMATWMDSVGMPDAPEGRIRKAPKPISYTDSQF